MFGTELFLMSLALMLVGQLFFIVVRIKSAWAKMGPDFNFGVFWKNNWVVFVCNVVLILGAAVGNAFGVFLEGPIALIGAGLAIEATIQKLFGK